MTRANSPPMVVDQKEDLLVANYAHRELQLSAKSGPKGMPTKFGAIHAVKLEIKTLYTEKSSGNTPEISSLILSPYQPFSTKTCSDKTTKLKPNFDTSRSLLKSSFNL